MAETDRLVEQLKRELEAERTKNKKLLEELRLLKEAQVTMQAQVEQEEEYITNTLLKKLDELKKDKEVLAVQVQLEEDLITNTLQKKLDQLRQEKVDLENKLEQEEEYIVNKLQKQFSVLIQQKNELEKKLEQETEEKEKLRIKTQEKITAYEARNAELREELKNLRAEKFIIDQRIQREHQKLSQVAEEKAMLEKDLEINSELNYNRKCRVRSLSTPLSQLPGSGQAQQTSGPHSQRGESSRHQIFLNPISPSPSPRSHSISNNSPSPLVSPRRHHTKVLKRGLVRCKEGQIEGHWERKLLTLSSDGELGVIPERLAGLLVEGDQTHTVGAGLGGDVINLDTVTVLTTLSNIPDHPFSLRLQDKQHSLSHIFSFDSKESLDEWHALIRDLCPNF